jgi:DNA-3-methyladenine glycosylase I
VLHKRQNLLLAYDNFDPDILSGYDSSDYERLMTDPKIIRSKLKVNAAVFNAKVFIHMRDKEQINFSDYLWRFIDYKPIQNNWYRSRDIPSYNSLSISIAADLKKRGFKFVGPVIIYAFMQAVGMINDHTLSCFANEVCKDLS